MWRGPFRPATCSFGLVATRRPPRLPQNHYCGMHRYFLTINTFDRRSTFEDSQYVDLVLDHFLRTSADYSCEVTAYCFMPDHMHALLEATSERANFLKFVAMFEQRSGYAFKQR